ncbi:lysine exporter LysO family protein [Salinicola rhizosphaerae]|uniref:Membrane protein n=1 Tax=Salinicola rhizosphaerae TaxID=1443141 RepID=A0ABQ3DU12_9GAMM|nr:lysine exporter LysO family protein [Salinicola rhizosphaerae]GHB16460.1 membrane protein [Salinicola rhizosphaerae]
MLLGLLWILLPLVLGYLIPIRHAGIRRAIDRGVNLSVYVILLLMGVGLGSLANLLDELSRIGTTALTLFIVIAPINLLALAWLCRRPVGRRAPERIGHDDGTPTGKWQALAGSTQLAGTVLVGVVIGVAARWFDHSLTALSETLATWTLYVLLGLVGCQLRNSGLGLRQILLNRLGLAMALTVFASSMLAGLAVAPLLDLPWNQGMAMAAGFGWYSLSGILIGDQLGPVLGGAAFFNDLARELLAFLLIPLFMQRAMPLAIGYSGATAMDVTLPIIQRYGGVTCVPLAIVSGFLLSLLSPLLILLLLSF